MPRCSGWQLCSDRQSKSVAPHAQTPRAFSACVRSSVTPGASAAGGPSPRLFSSSTEHTGVREGLGGYQRPGHLGVPGRSLELQATVGPRRGCTCWAVAFSPLLSAAGPCCDPEVGGGADEGGPLHSEEGGEPNPGERGGGARASSSDVRTELGSLGGGRGGLGTGAGTCSVLLLRHGEHCTMPAREAQEGLSLSHGWRTTGLRPQTQSDLPRLREPPPQGPCGSSVGLVGTPGPGSWCHALHICFWTRPEGSLLRPSLGGVEVGGGCVHMNKRRAPDWTRLARSCSSMWLLWSQSLKSDPRPWRTLLEASLASWG